MADFVNDFWHWFIVIVSLVSILILFPFIFRIMLIIITSFNKSKI